MKKNYFMLAATAALFAACAETDLVNDVNAVAEPQAIGFETFANKATRAENSGESYVENDMSNHHLEFYVWSSKEIAGTPNTFVDVYNPGTVTHNGTNWNADPKKYWDKAALNYYFYAAAPTGLAWTCNDLGGSSYITLNNYSLLGTNMATATSTSTRTWKTSTQDKDLMIAADCDIAKSHYYNVATPAAVNLDFIHILSRLNVAVMTTENSVVLTKLDIVGLKNIGSFKENADLGTGVVLANGTHKRWDTASSTTYTLTGALGATGLPLTKDATAVYTHEYLIIPQLQMRKDDCKGLGTAPANDAYIEINYTIAGELYKAFYGLAEVFGVDKNHNLAFNEGWQNNLTISIKPDAITFTCDAAAWDDHLGSGALPID